MTDKLKDEKFKILFVDDEPNVLRSLQRLFIDEDKVEVFTAASGKEGLEIVKNNDIAVIVSDQRMPEMGGAEFLEKTKRISPDSIRIILTGYADINAAISAINKGGVHRYFAKPWNDNDMVLAIWDSIERNRLIKENKRLTGIVKKQNEELKKWSAELEIYVQQQTIDLTKQNKILQKLNEKTEKNFNDFISAFSNLIELRDKSVSSHSNNVSVISEDMAKKMGMSAEEIGKIKTAAQLHDIGKIGIPDVMLLKNPSAMSPDELREYKKHSVRGQAVVSMVDDLRDAGILIRHHHECFDGKGFPDGLGGKDIPVGARIIAIADQFDRLIYGLKTHNIQSVLSRIRQLLGAQFDPELFDVLSATVKEKLSFIDDMINIEVAANVEMELSLKDLEPDMMLSRDIRSGTGLLLLSKGTTLDERNISLLKRSFYIDPAKTGIFVWVKKK
jgi:response regulator RpfG family c-di-GMP phosphodiesterase